MLADEKAHYNSLSTLITGAGQVPATSDDINFTYPKRSFGSEGRQRLKLATSIETLTLGAYLGAVENIQSSQLRLPIGHIAAYEAQHVSALSSRGREADHRPRVCSRAADRRCVIRPRRVRELIMPRQLYAASEAAAALGISLDTLRRWDKSGRIKVERDAGNRRVVPRLRDRPPARRRSRARTSAHTTASARPSTRSRPTD